MYHCSTYHLFLQFYNNIKNMCKILSVHFRKAIYRSMYGKFKPNINICYSFLNLGLNIICTHVSKNGCKRVAGFQNIDFPNRLWMESNCERKHYLQWAVLVILVCRQMHTRQHLIFTPLSCSRLRRASSRRSNVSSGPYLTLL